MDDVGHSPLLKFIVADGKISTMSGADFKIQVSFDNPNITSTVPERQKFRDAPESSFEKVLVEEVTNIKYDNSGTDAEHSTKLKEKTARDDTQGNADLNLESPKEDFVLTPVMTVTKEEAVFTKGDMKLQRVSVTEDISGTEIETVGQENITVNKDDATAIRDEVFSKQRIRRKTFELEQSESKKPKTRIPTLRFKQAVDQLKQDRNSFEDKHEPETPQPTPRRSSIPRLKDGKSSTLQSNVKDTVSQNVEQTNILPRLSDEFDKLYDEIAEGPDSLDNLSICSRIEDPVKVDNNFEEIIHAYEENEVQPIKVEKVRQSKIPLLKRKSENEIEVPKQSIPVIKQSISVDSCNIKPSESIKQDHDKIKSVALNKNPIKTGLISKRISENECPHETPTSSFENSVQNVQIPEKINNDLSSSIIKQDDICKEEIIQTKKDEKKINSEIVTIANIEEINNRAMNNVNSAMYVENNFNTELLEGQNEEDIPMIRGKVNRIIKRMDSKEAESKQSKRDLKDDTPKKKTVLSKIAMFEHPKITDVTLKANIRCVAQIPHVEQVEPIKTKNNSFDKRPKIVEEVLKALPARITEEENNNIEINDDKLKLTEIRNDVPAKVFDPVNNGNVFRIEIINTQPEVTIQSFEPVEINSNHIDKYINTENDSNPEKPNSLNTEEQFSPVYHGHAFDIIHDTQEQSETPIQSTKELNIGVSAPEYQNENKSTNSLLIGNFSNATDKNPIDVDLNSVKVESKASPITTYNNQGYTDNNQNTSLNLSTNKYIPQKIDTNVTLIENDYHWNTEQNISDNKQNHTEYYNDFIVNEPVLSYNRPEITSDIVKQEVKFERLKVYDDKIKIKELKEIEKLNRKPRKDEGQLRIHAYQNNEMDNKTKSISLVELDLGDAVKGRVKDMIVRMNSLDRLEAKKKELIDVKERPRKRSVSEKIALFEGKLTPVKLHIDDSPKIGPKVVSEKYGLSEEECTKKIEELCLAKTKYGNFDQAKMKYLELRDGGKMPAIGIGTALLEPKLTRYIVQAAIDLGYRTIDTAFIYGNEKEVGEAINEKIKDGTVSRSELFIISKLWSTFHRQDLVQRACRASLDAMGLDYFDLYLIHNPMSFKEGGDPVPKIANVLQYSEHDYLDAWFGVEKLVREGLVRYGGVSNFNSQQIERLVEKGKIKPVLNQVECHPYLSQHRLADFCLARNVKLCCFGVLGSKGTPQEHKSTLPPVIDDPLLRVMAAGLAVSPATLLISYQLALGRAVVVKASSAEHLWNNLQALTFTPSSADVSALHALNRNKRTFTFKGYY